MPFEVLHRHLLVDQKTLFQQRLNHVKGPGQALLPLIDGTTLLCWININGRIHPTFDFLGSRSWSNLVVVKISQFPQGAAEQWWVFSAAYLFALEEHPWIQNRQASHNKIFEWSLFKKHVDHLQQNSSQFSLNTSLSLSVFEFLFMGSSWAY